MYQLLIIFLLLFFVIIINVINVYDTYINYNYSNDIYAIRPPYNMAKLYNPKKLAPFRIYKSNFLNKWIEGFENSNKCTKDSNVINGGKQPKAALDIEKPSYLKDLQKFKFFPTDQCGTGYKYTGAFFKVPSGVQCNDDGIMQEIYKPAKVCAKIRHGQVISIEIIDGGKGYKNPTISIIAKDNYGEGAMAEVRAIDENGTIKYIEVTEGGHYYVKTPQVKILDVSKNDKCYLCQTGP